MFHKETDMSKIMNIGASIAVLAVAVGCCSTRDRCCSCKPAAQTVPAVKSVPMAPVPVAPVTVAPAPAAPVSVASAEKAGEFDKTGFVTTVVKGRLWVFAEGSKELTEFKASGKTPATHASRVKSGPKGMTIIAPEAETIVNYMIAKPGFHTMVKDGRLWIFAEGSKELEQFKASGKTPAVHTTRIKAGPLGMTIIAPDLAVLDAYMK